MAEGFFVTLGVILAILLILTLIFIFISVLGTKIICKLGDVLVAIFSKKKGGDDK